MSMIVLDGMGRSGTSLLARLMARMLDSKGFTYYYEPFHHTTPLGELVGWREMLGRVLLPGDADLELEAYLRRMEVVAGGNAFWKEIRLALKQDWLLAHFPSLQIVHITRDIMGVLSSHRREGAPEWMVEHRRIWAVALKKWAEQRKRLEEKGVILPESFDRIADLSDLDQYALIWSLNESFVQKLNSSRLLRIRYEDLCSEPGDALRQISDFVEIVMNKSMEMELRSEMQSSNEGVDPSGPWQAKSSVDMLEIWQKRLNIEDIEAIERVAGPTRRELGYQTL